jgi:hypothetical protein
MINLIRLLLPEAVDVERLEVACLHSSKPSVIREKGPDHPAVNICTVPHSHHYGDSQAVISAHSIEVDFEADCDHAILTLAANRSS